MLTGAVSFSYGVVNGIASEIPELEPGQRPPVEQDGYMYASDGKTILAVLRGRESRIVVTSDEISPLVKQAVVAVEDRRFWEHRGVDLRGIARAAWADVRHKEFVQGGSTITQQFVKNAYTEDARSVSRKLKEAILAWQLERRWSKDRILTAYLNTVYFGNGAYGVEMASKVYFGKRAKDLTLAQAALLAGIPANPSEYDVIANPRAARDRRDTVLRLMLDQRLIGRSSYEAALAARLPDPDDVTLPGTIGPGQYFAEYVKQQLVRFYGSGEVFGGGLRVYTSIELELQRLAREAIGKWLPEQRGPSAALVAIDPRDGRVLAIVGGNNFRESQFNVAAQGKRQAGSAFKPFVLAAALAKGIAPETSFESKPVEIGGWSVQNYEGSYLGLVDVETGTVYSDNSVYAQLAAQVGVDSIRTIARALGIKSRLDRHLGISLGTEEVNPLEMARAFASLANGGARVDGKLLRNEPRAVLRVVDGRRIDSNEPLHRQVLDPDDAALATSILQKVVEQGTGRAAALDDRPVAGKTGTTENHGDAWFVGYTPQLAVAVWVGYRSRVKPMLTEFQGEPVAGGTYPALIWRTFMKSALKHLEEPPEEFAPPADHYAAPVSVVVRNGRWLLDDGSCPDSQQIVFFAGFEPHEQASC
jgi:penicillin-binding protein 1A